MEEKLDNLILLAQELTKTQINPCQEESYARYRRETRRRLLEAREAFLKEYQPQGGHGCPGSPSGRP